MDTLAVPLSTSKLVLCPLPHSPALPAWALTVDDDAQQEGDEEEEDGAHQSHAKPGELAVSTVLPACLPPELLTCGKVRKAGRARVLLAVPPRCFLPAWLAEPWLDVSQPLVPGVLVGPLISPRALQGTCPTTPLPEHQLLLVALWTGMCIQAPRLVPRPSGDDLGLVLSLSGGCSVPSAA